MRSYNRLVTSLVRYYGRPVFLEREPPASEAEADAAECLGSLVELGLVERQDELPRLTFLGVLAVDCADSLLTGFGRLMSSASWEDQRNDYGHHSRYHLTQLKRDL